MEILRPGRDHCLMVMILVYLFYCECDSTLRSIPNLTRLFQLQSWIFGEHYGGLYQVGWSTMHIGSKQGKMCNGP